MNHISVEIGPSMEWEGLWQSEESMTLPKDFEIQFFKTTVGQNLIYNRPWAGGSWKVQVSDL